MKVKDCMTRRPICVSPAETLNVAARLMARHNLGMLPVRANNGVAVGILTDRDIVLRCIAAERDPKTMRVRDIMSRRIVGVSAEAELSAAEALMAKEQVRRLPVLDEGRLIGMISVADLMRSAEGTMEAAECMEEIFRNVRTV